ncbi:hypothetical protein C5167_025055 [Papaver somniferum]|uniref:Sulfotransferase n=1 Tax=Papaver somniferum TaxID=3469 RepID=A0A4Y7JTA5_PAPSO|nr:cytosolic sulfotransferase 14-like [Papaver somniferum]RZC63272.1 hypothetical protein C5167_025055 [Papaver somniferum]
MATTVATDDENSSEFMSVGRFGLGVSVLYQYQGFWAFAEALENVKDFQQNFKALDTDIILASVPKSGTVWLKALAFAIVNRYGHPIFSSSHHHPLLTITPHDLVPFVDFKHVYPSCSVLDFTKNSSQHTDHYDSPCRLIATHFPYPSLPASIKDNTTNCKIVYICRNPLDTFISLWHFINKIRTMPESNESTIPPRNKKESTPLLIEDAFEFFCDGVSEFGPYWDHVLGYWKASLEKPHKVLFLKYEDLKKEPEPQLKNLAEFLGYGFSEEEESQGVIKDILSLCSFQHLKNLDVNKNGMAFSNFVANKDFFRKGEVGDWKNYLTPVMVERLAHLTEDKFRGSGLAFQNFIP